MRRYLSLIILPFIALTVSCEKNNQGEGDGNEPAGDKPVINVESITVSSEGGQTSLPFTITNEVEGGTMLASSESDWISGITPGTGEVTFEAEANEDYSERSATIDLTYFYGQGDTVCKSVAIVQEAAVMEYDYEPEIVGVQGNFFSAENRYTLYFSDKEFLGDWGDAADDSYVYYLSFISDTPADPENPMPTSTTYMPQEGMSATLHQFSRESCWYFCENGTVSGYYMPYFADGTLNITVEGDVVSVDASLMDSMGQAHHLVWSGTHKFNVDPTMGVPAE